MPVVGTGKNAQHFPYDKAGIKAAKTTAKRSGKPITIAKGPARAAAVSHGLQGLKMRAKKK